MTSRIVYMGTPAFACPALDVLAAVPGVEVVLTVTQPDRPWGRGRKLQSPPVKLLAEQFGLPVYQVGSLRTVEARQRIVDARPDLIVVAAFGLILGSSMLALPKRGCVNLHASLLPAYRGASPIAAAILNGEAETGVTLMRMERGLDTGPMYGSGSTPIGPAETTESLTGRLAGIAAELLARNLTGLLDGTLVPVAQPVDDATVTRPLVKADGWIDWTGPAVGVERKIRAMWSWPRAWTATAAGTLVQVHEAEAVQSTSMVPGEIVSTADGPVIACGDGAILVRRGQVAGRAAMDGRQLRTLRDLASGTRLGGDAPETPGPVVRPVEA